MLVERMNFKDITFTGITPKEAAKVQEALRSEVKIEPFKRTIKTIGGADVSLNLFSTTLYAGIVVMSYADLEIQEKSLVKIETTFPYIPGFLSFREAPGLFECWKNLKQKPDVLVVDGQGIAHPRRMGIASHVGVLLDIPTVGCAKSMLYGRIAPNNGEVGTRADITDPKTGEVIGAALFTKKRSKPLIVSPGHKMSVDDAVSVILTTLRGYRLAEPTRQAHLAVNEFRVNGV
jgi:deoxyribonuclease V